MINLMTRKANTNARASSDDEVSAQTSSTVFHIYRVSLQYCCKAEAGQSDGATLMEIDLGLGHQCKDLRIQKNKGSFIINIINGTIGFKS